MQQPGSVTLQLSDCGRLWFSKIPSMVSPTNLVISAMQPHLPSTPRLSLNLGWPQWFIWLTEAEATLLDSEDRLEGGLNLLLSSLLPLRLFPLRTCSVGSQLSDCEKPWLPRQRRVSVPGGSVSGAQLLSHPAQVPDMWVRQSAATPSFPRSLSQSSMCSWTLHTKEQRGAIRSILELWNTWTY